MKLLELLVKERVKWPSMGNELAQDDIGRIIIPNHPLRMEMSSLPEGLPVADDWQTAIVTKEQYDNACKLVDDGYTLWFGGECPVPYDTHVQVWMNDGTKGDSQYPLAKHWRWEWDSGVLNIIAYKIAVAKPDGSREPTGFNCRCVDEELSIVYEPADLLSLHVPDVVNHPSHYTNGKVECIDAIESATVGKTGIEAVCVANVIKYLWRYEDKNGLEDIKKAQWYLNKLIEVKK